MNKKKEEPVYLQIIQCAKSGLSVLDPSIQKDIIAFIQSKQHKNGGFLNRSNNPDSYYSLFGSWLCQAAGLDEQNNLLKHYVIAQKENKTVNSIDKLSLILIAANLFPGVTKFSFFSFLRTQLKQKQTINPAYQVFLLTLILDALGKNKTVFNLFARIWLMFYNPKKNVPCSLLAAFTFAKKNIGLNYKNLQDRLLKFNVAQSGFKAFESSNTCDMLSTGVALFSLKKTGHDLRIIKPGCLNFIEENYESGAFLSGDGDDTKDLEYTFYGLLSLGCLAEDG